jgi:prepilin-type processing-associated H-X9-DG protein/prepilin-type N-terminal cleavage/methylation domain-containing protein
MTRRASARRAGWTLLESLVAISVLGLLMAILIPAVMSARESSRRVQCTDHLRQFGAALHSFEAANQRLPAMVRETGRDPVHNAPFSRHLYSPHVYLLPYLDQMPLFSVIDVSKEFPGTCLPADLPSDWNVAIPVFLCPSDAGHPGTNYRCCTGSRPFARDSERWWGGNGAFADLRGIPVAQFRDGLSHTVVMSERIQSDNDITVFSEADYWYAGVPLSLRPIAEDDMLRICGALSSSPTQFQRYAGRVWVTAGYANTLYNHVLAPNAAQPDCSADHGGPGMGDATVGAFKASSRHSGGVNVLYGDGSVRFIANDVDLLLWRALATRNQSDQT